MSNENKSKAKSQTNDDDRPGVISTILGHGKSMIKPILSGVGAHAVVRGAELVWSRASRKSTEDAARAAVGSGSSFRPF